MRSIELKKVVSGFSIRWTLVTFCYAVLFHLLPSFTFAPFSFPLLPTSSLAGFLIWLTSGIVAVSAYVGWRSERSLFFEPAIASLFYSLVLMVAYLEPGKLHLIDNLYNRYTFPLGLLILSFVLGFAPASLISWSRIRRLSRIPKA